MARIAGIRQEKTFTLELTDQECYDLMNDLLAVRDLRDGLRDNTQALYALLADRNNSQRRVS